MAERTAVERTFEEAKAEQPRVDRKDPQRVQKTCLVILLGLAVMYTLYFAQDVLLPVFLAFLLSLLLRTPTRALHRLRLPEPLAAAAVVLIMVAGIGAVVASVSDPAINWLNRAPTLMADLRDKLQDLEREIASARQATEQLERMTESGDRPTEVVVKGPNLADQILSQTQIVLAQVALTVALTFFFLAFGRRALEGVLRSMPDVGDRLRLSDIVNTVQINISTYLLTITAINFCLGAVVAALMWALGMPSPLLWGILAALLNFIPYLGSVTMAGVLTLVSLLTFDDWLSIVAPPALFIMLTALEGNFVTPTIVGKRLTLNPIFVFGTVLFWGWLWGVPGALLAVPILAVFKILCDATPRLRTLGALLG